MTRYFPYLAKRGPSSRDHALQLFDGFIARNNKTESWQEREDRLKTTRGALDQRRDVCAERSVNNEEWCQRWTVFENFILSGEGKTAGEVAQWVQDHDIFADTETLNQNQIKRFSLTTDSKPTFTTVCCFARETGNHEAVKLACEASHFNRGDHADFVVVLGGKESEFGKYCANLAYPVVEREATGTRNLKRAKRTVGIPSGPRTIPASAGPAAATAVSTPTASPAAADLDVEIAQLHEKQKKIEEAIDGGLPYLGTNDAKHLFPLLVQIGSELVAVRERQTILDDIRQPKRRRIDIGVAPGAGARAPTGANAAGDASAERSTPGSTPAPSPSAAATSSAAAAPAATAAAAAATSAGPPTSTEGPRTIPASAGPAAAPSISTPTASAAAAATSGAPAAPDLVVKIAKLDKKIEVMEQEEEKIEDAINGGPPYLRTNDPYRLSEHLKNVRAEKMQLRITVTELHKLQSLSYSTRKPKKRRKNGDEDSRHPSVSGHAGGGGNPAGFSGCSGLSGGAGSPAAAASEEIRKERDARSTAEEALAAETRRREDVAQALAAEKGKREEAVEDRVRCVVCFDRVRTVYFQTCHHLVVCGQCSDELSACPICNTIVRKRSKNVIIS